MHQQLQGILIIGIFMLITISVKAQSDTSHHHAMHGMTAQDSAYLSPHAAYSLHKPMSREGSGTSWQPDENLLMSTMYIKNRTMLMWSGAIFGRYTATDLKDETLRGDEQFDAPNWFMFMATQRLGKNDLLTFNSMFSLDYWTVGETGYPLLFQTGETFHDVPLADRQHNHDLFSALGLAYTHSFSPLTDLTVSFGYPGEPALGPPAFMHRLSAVYNPNAPIAHHWQDATHITYGNATLGFRYKNIKLEGSVFTGREPDEERLDFDEPKFDSYSYRVSVNPVHTLSFQFSRAKITSPEPHLPDTNLTRTTFSALHTRGLKGNNFIASAFIWGLNNSSPGKNLHSLLFESTLNLGVISIYGRYEFVEKDAAELFLPPEFNDRTEFALNAFTLGLNKTLFSRYKADLSLGAQGTLNFPDQRLERIYGEMPISAQVYLRLAPALGQDHKRMNH